MLKLNPPKIVDGLAKFDGRKKKYVPYPEIYNQSSETEKLKILVFSELQTLWERLQKEHPGNIRYLKSVSKFFQLAAPVESFIFKPCLESFTSQWPYWNLSPSNFHYQTSLYTTKNKKAD